MSRIAYFIADVTCIAFFLALILGCVVAALYVPCLRLPGSQETAVFAIALGVEFFSMAAIAAIVASMRNH